MSPVTHAPTGFAHDFSLIPVHSKAPVKLQTKLKVNTSGDIYEQEADRLSEQVTGTAELPLQRTSARGGRPTGMNEQAADEGLRTKRIQANDSGEMVAPPLVHEVLRSSGEPLDPSVRAFMEPRFGHDFSRVRVHTDARAVESARALRARAYTVGQHIAFGAGEYRPHLMEGRRLLAHELTHTLQQRAGTRLNDGLGLPVNNTERKAERVVSGNELGSGVHVRAHTPSPALQLQSQPDDDPLAKTKKPTDRASMLLQIFWKGVTNTGLSFTNSSESDFNTALNDADARVETIQALKHGAYVTYTFITNKKTGFIYVRERQDVNGSAQYYQSGRQVENAASDTTSQAKSSKEDKSASEKQTKTASGSVEKKATDEATPSVDEKPPEVKSKPKSTSKIDKIILPSGWMGGQDQTWLPGTDHHGKPLQQGDLTRDLENALIKLVKQIKNSASPPKELQISVTLFRTDLPTPGYKYAAANLGFNIKRFLEARLSKSIKVTETHKFVDNGKTSPSAPQFLNTITPVY